MPRNPAARRPQSPAALRAELDAAAARLRAAETHATGLRFLLDSVPDLHRMQPLAEFLETAAERLATLLGSPHAAVLAPADEAVSAMTVEVEGMVAVPPGSDTPPPELRHATGRLAALAGADDLPARLRRAGARALQTAQPEPGEGAAAVPLCAGGRAIGVLLVDEANHFAADGELLRAFADQCGAALRNVLLYSLATTDATTGTHIRSFVLQRLRQAVKAAHRRGEACAVLRLDVDGFRALNERHGRAAGDAVLNALGVMLRVVVRDTDIVGRCGADEFLVVLPGTDADGLRTVGRRLAEQWQWLTIDAGAAQVPVRVSMGGACLPAVPDGGRIDAAGFDALAEAVVARAGAALDGVRGTASMAEVASCAWGDEPDA